MKEKKTKSWLGAAFGMLFVMFGLLAAYSSAGKMIVGYVASSNWIEAPATLHSLKLDRKHGETTTYSVKSEYSYSFNGFRYRGNRVSLSTASDNVGKYWQELYSNLRKLRTDNEVSVWVNPKDPSNAVLDRTLRWKSIVFASMFLFLFGGLGGLFTWASLQGVKSLEDRLHDEEINGITCNEKNGGWFFVGFGSIFLVMGLGTSVMILPDAISEGDYAALLVLLFVIVGAGIMYHGFKIYRSYTRFGPTPLSLYPVAPGIGGKLGGSFTLLGDRHDHLLNTETALTATLQCIKKRRSGDDTIRSVCWQEHAAVYTETTENSVVGKFIFDVPENCIATKEWENDSSISWSVSVEGHLGDVDQRNFDRSWEIYMDEVAPQNTVNLDIPESFLERQSEKFKASATASAVSQIPITEDDEYIYLVSKAGRHLGSHLTGILIGGGFAVAGYFLISDWWPGYIFIFLGLLVAIGSIYSMGKSLEVKIDKNTKTLFTRTSWFGYIFSHFQEEIFDSEQFRLKRTSSSQAGSKYTEFYAVEFMAHRKSVRIAEQIESKQAAAALKQLIIDTCPV